jgi:molybdopterin synthase sulfur carrier subunit
LSVLQLVYFARVREAIGLDGEVRTIAPGTTIASLVDQLSAENARYANAFANRSKLRFALDQHMVVADSLLDGAKELAIFPPVTGG